MQHEVVGSRGEQAGPTVFGPAGLPCRFGAGCAGCREGRPAPAPAPACPALLPPPGSTALG
jgi:hypothetical protein